MKKYFAIFCIAAAFVACNKNNEITTPDGKDVVSFNFSVNQDGADTKAKTGWETGDVVYIFFKDIPEKYVKMTHTGSGWDYYPSDSFVRSDFEDKVLTLTAIHIPSFIGEVTVTYEEVDNGEGGLKKRFKLTDSQGEYIYAYYMSATGVSYEIDSDPKVKATINMEKPTGFVQFFVPMNAEELAKGHGYRLMEDHLQPQACLNVNLSGYLGLNTSRPAGYAVKGYRTTNNKGDGIKEGFMFSAYVTSTDTPTDYDFDLITYQSEAKPYALGTQELIGNKTISSGVIFNLPNPSSTWTALAPWVYLGNGLKWATGNLDNSLASPCITNPESIGKYFQWGSTSPWNHTSSELIYPNWVTGTYYNEATGNTITWEANVPYRIDKATHQRFSKYTAGLEDYSTAGTTDDYALTVLQPEDDAATQLAGTNWRIPTQEEYATMATKTATKGTWTDIIENPAYLVNGGLNTSINGVNTFWPMTGFWGNVDPGPEDRMEYGMYMTSSLNTADPEKTWYFQLYLNPETPTVLSKAMNKTSRRWACKVIRPVYDPQQIKKEDLFL